MQPKKLPVGRIILSRLLFGVAGLFALVAGLIIFTIPRQVQAQPADLSNVVIQYPAVDGTRLDTCTLCHTSNIPALNPFGTAYNNNGRTIAALILIENLDSDGDGFSNLQELMALSFPGNPADMPPAASPTPTFTNTAVPPTLTSTNTAVPPTPTPTSTSIVPSPTATSTGTEPPYPPPPTVTVTTPPPTATSTATQPLPTDPTPTSPSETIEPSSTPEPPPTDELDLDIKGFKVTSKVKLEKVKPIEIRLDIKNDSQVEGQGQATVIGMQNGVEIYRQSLTVSDPVGGGHTRYYFPGYTPTVIGKITWTVTLTDNDPDVDMRERTTEVKQKEKDEEKDDDEDDEHGGSLPEPGLTRAMIFPMFYRNTL